MKPLFNKGSKLLTKHGPAVIIQICQDSETQEWVYIAEIEIATKVETKTFTCIIYENEAKDEVTNVRKILENYEC